MVLSSFKSIFAMQVDYNNLTSEEKKKFRNNQIRERFAKLSTIKEYGVRKYSQEWVLTKIASSFGLSCATIENIVFYRNGYN